MVDYYEDNHDLRFYVERYLPWKQLLEAAGGAPGSEEACFDRQDVLARLRGRCAEVGRVAATEVAPVAREIDRSVVALEGGVVRTPEALVAVFERLAAMELHGMCLPPTLGGAGLPVTLYFATVELLARADVGVAAHYSFHAGIATALHTFGSLGGDAVAHEGGLTPFEEAITSIASGAAWGSLDLLEPDGDEALLELQSTATLGEDGRWRVSGTKSRVTSGHGRWHLVLVRTDPPSEEGRNDGLSLFLVEARADRRGEVVVESVADKLGQRAAPTVTVRFTEAEGQLIGKRGLGRRRMLRMLNLARIAAGMQALGVCESALHLAQAYAASSRSAERREPIAEMIDATRTDVQGLRALACAAAVHEELALQMSLRLRVAPPQDREEREFLTREVHRHTAEARRLTPLLKVIAADRAVRCARRCVQIHGGGGTTSDFGAEKLLRDAMMLPVYEGTQELVCQLVARELVLGAIRRPQAALRQAATARWTSVRGSPLERRVARLQTLAHACQQHLITRLAGRRFSELRLLPWNSWSAAITEWDPGADLSPLLVHAASLTRLLAEVAIAEVLLEQATLHPDRTEVLERHLERAEPRVRYLHDRVTSTGDRLVGELGEV
jgi:alkylation response protein AidB-like acyl-CoA dehydrogenase